MMSVIEAMKRDVQALWGRRLPRRDMGPPRGSRQDPGRDWGGCRRRRPPGAPLLGALLAVVSAMTLGGNAPARAEPVRLVALGDSLTAGYLLPASAAFPAVLERMLRAKGRDVTIANAGVSGDTATGGLERVDWSVPDGTEGVILELGANDMLRGLDPKVTAEALAGIVARLKSRGIPVLLAGMRAAPNFGPGYQARFDAIYPDLAGREGLTLYPFFLDGIIGDPAQHLADGLHPNAKGVETIAARILPTVEAFLGNLRQGAAGAPTPPPGPSR